MHVVTGHALVIGAAVLPAPEKYLFAAAVEQSEVEHDDAKVSLTFPDVPEKYWFARALLHIPTPHPIALPPPLLV